MRLLSLFILLIVSFSGFCQSNKAVYQYTVDLTNVVDDRIFVTLVPPIMGKEEVTFNLPKIIPGTYAIADYGRFVSEIYAFDKKGRTLPVERIDTNAWVIKSAKKLAEITYWIEDSFDTELAGPEVFWPAGTNIEEEKNFILNAAGVFGYFDGMKKVPFEVNVIRGQNQYGTTGLIPERVGEPLTSINFENAAGDNFNKVDVYSTGDYDALVDSPIMYAKADTAVIKVANTEVLIGSYSPNQMITAKEIANSVREVLMAQKEYLGGELPVEKYAFIFYFTDKAIRSYGALEHSYSSLYFMPERNIDQMNQNLRDFAAHEFFHIVTPLNIHSEEIGNFDFNDPKMSKHLWMYEGVTEYFAGHMQVKYALISPVQYLNILRQKLLIADDYDNVLPFTELSKKVLEQYGDQYYNVYQKGALIGMCLDIKLRQLSEGAYGMQNLMKDLSKKFGKDIAFKDDELFAEITALTYPEIGDFLDTYVAASNELPLTEIFKLVGVLYYPEKVEGELTLGIDNNTISVVDYEDEQVIAMRNIGSLNEQGKALQFVEGDILLGINGERLPELGPETSSFISKHRAALSEGDTLRYTVLRKLGEEEERKEVELQAQVRGTDVTKKHLLEFDPAATEAQLKLRSAWLEP
ncbi:MAG: peptidase M61 [Cyclobacteriaceae bacterium]